MDIVLVILMFRRVSEEYNYGLVGIVYLDEKENIENVCSHYLNVNCSCVLKDTKKNKTYINIIPKTNYNISLISRTLFSDSKT